MATIGRRRFIITSGAATLGLSLTTLLTHKRAHAGGGGDYGDLVPDPDGVLDLPEGFTYKILEEKGDDMDDGYRVPGRADGMACFQGPDNTLILLRNHEVTAGDKGNGPYKGGQEPSPMAYEPNGMGGVTRLVVDATTFERISSNLVLIGTVRNCCGGPSPWGWISCEEDTSINGDYRHGYTFLCPPDADSVQAPQRLDGYGRFNHEAVAVDPSNNYAYMTEDRGDSCVYRFVPDSMDEPFHGLLQALKVVGEDKFATTNMAVGDVVQVEWVDIDQPDPDGDTVRNQGHDKGAAVFVRGEGICFFEGQVYICSTAGGNGKGQIFRLIDGDEATLELVVASPGADVLDKPDNICVAPWGELFLCEDGDGGNCIRWVTAEGEVRTFAHNVGSSSEFAGVCFSPDGKAMFVNIQSDHRTLVITGPFPEAMMPGGSDDGGEGESETTDGESDSAGDTSEGDTTSDTSEGEGDGGTSSGPEGEGESGGDSESDGSGTDSADEIGDDGSWPNPGFGRSETDGCACTTTDEPAGVGALVTGLATMALGTLIRERDEAEGE